MGPLCRDSPASSLSTQSEHKASTTDHFQLSSLLLLLLLNKGKTYSTNVHQNGKAISVIPYDEEKHELSGRSWLADLPDTLNNKN